MSSVLTDLIFPAFQHKFSSPHPFNLRVDKDNRQFYEGRNFGTVEWRHQENDDDQLVVIGTIHDIDGRPKLQVVQQFNHTVDYSCLKWMPSVIPTRYEVQI